MRVLLALLVLLWSLPSLAEKQRVAVLELQGDLPQNILLLVSDEVRTGALEAFSGHENYSVMTRENMFTLLSDMGLDPEECMADANCEVDAGRNIGAAYVLAGQVTMVEGTLMMTLKLFTTGSGEMLKSERVNAVSQTGLIESTKAASQRMVSEGLGLTTSSRPRRQPEDMSSSTTLDGESGDYMENMAALEAAQAERERLEEEEAAAEAARKAEIARLEEERRQAEIARKAERERLAAQERALQKRLEVLRREEFKNQGDPIRVEASKYWAASARLRARGGPEAEAAVLSFLDRFEGLEITVTDGTGTYSEKVFIPEVQEARTWFSPEETAKRLRKKELDRVRRLHFEQKSQAIQARAEDAWSALASIRANADMMSISSVEKFIEQYTGLTTEFRQEGSRYSEDVEVALVAEAKAWLEKYAPEIRKRQAELEEARRARLAKAEAARLQREAEAKALRRETQARLQAMATARNDLSKARALDGALMVGSSGSTIMAVVYWAAMAAAYDEASEMTDASQATTYQALLAKGAMARDVAIVSTALGSAMITGAVLHRRKVTKLREERYLEAKLEAKK